MMTARYEKRGVEYTLAETAGLCQVMTGEAQSFPQTGNGLLGETLCPPPLPLRPQDPPSHQKDTGQGHQT